MYLECLNKCLLKLKHAVLCEATSAASDSATPWAAAHRAPLSAGLSRQAH